MASATRRSLDAAEEARSSRDRLARDAVRLAGLLRDRRLHVDPQPGGLPLRPAALAAQPPAGHPDGARRTRRPPAGHPPPAAQLPEHRYRAALRRPRNELLADAISPPIDSARHFVRPVGAESTARRTTTSSPRSTPSARARRRRRSPRHRRQPWRPRPLRLASPRLQATAGHLAWDPVAGATSYNIYWSTAAGVTTCHRHQGSPPSRAVRPDRLDGRDGVLLHRHRGQRDRRGRGVGRGLRHTGAPAAAPAAPTGLTAGPATRRSPSPGTRSPERPATTSTGPPPPGVTPPTAPDPGREVAVPPDRRWSTARPTTTSSTAVNAIGESPASAQVSATPGRPAGGAVPPPPGSPRTPGDGQVTSTWDPVPGATSYNVYWSTPPASRPPTARRSPGPGTPGGSRRPTHGRRRSCRPPRNTSTRRPMRRSLRRATPSACPYSAGLDELRTYLGQLGLPLWQVRQALLPFSGGGNVAQESAVAGRAARLPPHGADLIATPNLVAPEIAWNTLRIRPVAVAPVPEFLQAASLTYEGLLELIEVEWVQDGLGVEITGIDDTCSTSVQSLAPLDSTSSTGRTASSACGSPPATRCGSSISCSGPRQSAPARSTTPRSARCSVSGAAGRDPAAGRPAARLLPGHRHRDATAPRTASTTSSLYSRIFLNAGRHVRRPGPRSGGDRDRRHVGRPRALATISPASRRRSAWTLRTRRRSSGSPTTAHARQPQPPLPRRGSGRGGKPVGERPLTLAGSLDPAAASAAAALAPLFASPAATLAFLARRVRSVSRVSRSTPSRTCLTPPTATTLNAADRRSGHHDHRRRATSGSRQRTSS